MNALDMILEVEATETEHAKADAILERAGKGVKGARGKRGAQRDDESFAQYNERLRVGRMEQASALRAKRDRNKLKIAQRAMDLLSANVTERTAILSNPVLTDPSLASAIRYLEVTPGKLESWRNGGIETLTQTDAVERASLAVKLGKRERTDIVASLTMRFKGFSRIKGKVNTSQYDDVQIASYPQCGTLQTAKTDPESNQAALHKVLHHRYRTDSFKRLDQSIAAYRVMLRHGKASNSEPLCNIRPLPVSVPHTPRFEPSSLEVFTTQERLTPKRDVTTITPKGSEELHLFPSVAHEYRKAFASVSEVNHAIRKANPKPIPVAKPLTVADCAYLPIYSYPRLAVCYPNH